MPLPEFKFSSIAKIVAVAAISLFFIILLVAGCTSISPGYVGVEVNKADSARSVDAVALKTGYIIVNPLLTSVIRYPTFIQTAKWTRSTSEGSSNDDSITFTSRKTPWW